MRVTKSFTAKIAIGIKGVALLSIDESDDVEQSLICNDIDQIGIEEWYEYSFDEKPSEAGVYEVRGTATFTEDDVIYSIKILNRMRNE
jgi:hypothetical protein